MILYVGRPLALLFLWDMAVAIAYVYFKQEWLALTHLPLAVFGGALGVILGFRNNTSYARWWEARTLWGSIVNYSRSLARQTVTLISTGDRKHEHEQLRIVQRRIVYYQLAYVNALRCQLRGEDPLPDLRPFLCEDDIDSLRRAKNVATDIQRRIDLLIKESCERGWLSVIELGLLDDSLTALANAQGGSERIKNTPMPKQYDYFPMLFVHLYCILLPLGVVANLGLLTPVGSTVIGFVFLAFDKIGRDLEFPFNNSIHDVPLTSICRTIEINLRQCLGETELPAPIEPMHGVLW